MEITKVVKHFIKRGWIQYICVCVCVCVFVIGNVYFCVCVYMLLLLINKIYLLYKNIIYFIYIKTDNYIFVCV